MWHGHGSKRVPYVGHCGLDVFFYEVFIGSGVLASRWVNHGKPKCFF